MEIRRSMMLATCATAFLVASPAAGQEIGVLKGLNSANIQFGGDGAAASADPRHGIVGGKYLSHVIRGPVAIELDVLMAMKGTEFEFGQSDAGKAKLLYLDFPLLARLNIPVSGAARLHLIAGPSFNFKLSGTFDREGSAADDRIKVYETALVVGGGATVNRFRIDARYGLGLTDIAKEADFTARNRVVSVLVGVVLKKEPERPAGSR